MHLMADNENIYKLVLYLLSILTADANCHCLVLKQLLFDHMTGTLSVNMFSQFPFFC